MSKRLDINFLKKTLRKIFSASTLRAVWFVISNLGLRWSYLVWTCCAIALILSVYQHINGTVITSIKTFVEWLNGEPSIALAFAIILISFVSYLATKPIIKNVYALITTIGILCLTIAVPSDSYPLFLNLVSWQWIITLTLSIFLISQFNWLIFKIKDIYKSRPRHYKSPGFKSHTETRDIIDTGWARYADEITHLISNTPNSDESFAIGVNGEWGSGKTKFLQTLKQRLSEDYTIIEFDAWRCTKPESIITDFFNLLSEHFEVDSVKKDIALYAGKLSHIDRSGVSDILKATFSHDESLDGQKDKVRNALAKKGSWIIVLIDDIDRLRAEELNQLLKLIRITANFPNLCYIVTYDRNYILHQMKSIGLHNAPIYLRKIFQTEIPLFSQSYIYLLLEQDLLELKPYWHDTASIDGMLTISTREGKKLVLEFVKTFRDVKILYNSLIFTLRLVESAKITNEISYEDLFLLEIIRVFRPEIYETLYKEKEKLITNIPSRNGNGQIYTFDKDNEMVKQQMLDLPTIAVLSRLFCTHEGIKSIRRHNNYSKYFDFRLAGDTLSIETYLNLLNASDEEIYKQLHNLNLDNYSRSLHNHVALFTISNCVPSQIQMAKNFFRIVFHLFDYNDLPGIGEIIRSSLDSTKCKLNISAFVSGLITDKIKDANTDPIRYNKLLASLYSERTTLYNDSEDFSNYLSIINDSTIIQLLEINFDKYLKDQPFPPIEEITNHDSPINKFLRDACVVYLREIVSDNQEVHCRQQLLLNKIKELYSANPEANELEKFSRNMTPYFDDVNYYYGVEEEIYENKTRLFGSPKDYDQFVSTCFAR